MKDCGSDADVRYLMITHMNREMEGRIGRILKDKREQRLPLERQIQNSKKAKEAGLLINVGRDIRIMF